MNQPTHILCICRLLEKYCTDKNQNHIGNDGDEAAASIWCLNWQLDNWGTDFNFSAAARDFSLSQNFRKLSATPLPSSYAFGRGGLFVWM